jgi:hypothetical protein
MIIYRITIKTSKTGGMFMDGTNSLNLALEEAKHIQTENPHYKVGVDAEEWPTLTSMKYRWYRLTGLGDGFLELNFSESTVTNLQALPRYGPSPNF